MPTFPSYTAETALAIYTEYWNFRDSRPDMKKPAWNGIMNRVSCATLAKKYNLSKGTVFQIIHKAGRFNARVLKWQRVSVELFKPERQMTLEEMGQAAGGPPGWVPHTHQTVEIPTAEWED
jgi:hypothetical protein